MHNLELPAVSSGFFLRKRSRTKDQKNRHFAAFIKPILGLAELLSFGLYLWFDSCKFSVYEV
jgi:hypothetical protein